MRSFTFAIVALCLAVTHGFAPAPKTVKTTSLNLFQNEKQTAATLIAAAFLAANVATAAPAFAAMTGTDFGGSSQVIAGRSGGRSGGRARSGGGGGARRPSSYSAAPRTTYRSQTTIVRPMIASPPVVISPFGGGYGGYGYNPMGGMGLGYAMGSMNNNGNAAREYRQESEIQSEKVELEQAKARAAELETRIKALEEVTAKSAAKK
eukprot:CAMPEP_0119015362 /NCGR_PEP_ID=MMETSP1176-20130426/10894_1 /TAXON_ID=265551 /ORGANISM="Synedropsis recta cf, Strain CCMP1620" /LENGTH=206 /DNA_ID=CAMNT_0006968649 /DNA_START=66 /DNA_END=686 /DNA_ORIENTATION=+